MNIFKRLRRAFSGRRPAPCSAPVYCQCSCGTVLSFNRDPWECGSWHINCECGKRIKVRVLVDEVPNAEVERPQKASKGDDE